jgi:error-prone DNA polymerase
VIADDAIPTHLQAPRTTFGAHAYLALSPQQMPGDALHLHRLAEARHAARMALLATGDVLYHASERRILPDVVTWIRDDATIDAVASGANASPTAICAARRRWDDCWNSTLRCWPIPKPSPTPAASTSAPSNTNIRTRPTWGDRTTDARTPFLRRKRLVWEEGVPFRYPAGATPELTARLKHEVRLITDMQYAPYFLTVQSIIRLARSREILCQIRGSAVCFALEITEIDPTLTGLLFERFISAERHAAQH